MRFGEFPTRLDDARKGGITSPREVDQLMRAYQKSHSVPRDVVKAVESFTVPPDATRVRPQSSGLSVSGADTRINSMSPKPRDILRGLIEKYGSTLLDDPRRCQALLRDLCGNHKREISVLVGAIQERVPTEILAPSQLLPAQCLYERLASRLEENLALSADASRWAVSAWTFALDRQEPIWNPPTPGDAGVGPYLGSTRPQPVYLPTPNIVGEPVAQLEATACATPVVSRITVAPPPDITAIPPGREAIIYLSLVGEGINVLRTVRAENLGRDYYRIADVIPEGEQWEFTPGQVGHI